ncbi:transcription termination factor MTERF15, mitochondrial-like isoform X2 [Pistacia vera]|uniref:transcription termination factor MTERF15, mitochondrial-like isoform X2 n=1 Tax=Pistacia vera TaxID=55513 RepID=UPI001262CFE0|nr:transcription termination factor MTERF15, mitochondrial-like isoform X2 [Pistacia vera]
MSGYVYRRLVYAQVLPNIYRCVVPNLGTNHVDLCLSFLPTSIRSFSNKIEQVREDYLFTVPYLINSCGLSPEKAESVSKRIKLQSAEQPDLVLKVLRNRGFTTAHIAKLVGLRPSLLLANPEKSILPKFKFFNTFGITDAELARVCSSNPTILGCSLENLLIPNYKFLKSVLLSDANVIKSFRNNSWLFLQDLPKTLSPKLAVLRELGMPENFVALILTCYISIVLQKREKFDKNVKKVIEMGFDPQKSGFIHAMQVFVAMSQSTREHKLDVFRGWGWSDEDIMLVFRKRPSFMNASESKIMNAMDLLVNKMGWQSTDIALCPDIFLMSLEKRVIPRCLVIKVLQSKGLVKKKLCLSSCVKPVEKLFLDRFVTKYLDQVPDLMNIYQKKEGFQALDMNIYVSSSKL